jgi:hypothetical protein
MPLAHSHAEAAHRYQHRATSPFLDRGPTGFREQFPDAVDDQAPVPRSVEIARVLKRVRTHGRMDGRVEPVLADISIGACP